MRYLPAILLMLFLFSCSEDEDSAITECQLEDSSEISMEDTFAYTGAKVTVIGEFCLDQTVKVLIDDLAYNLTETLPAQISFVMPELTEDSVTIKVQSDGIDLGFEKKIAVYPGNGTWIEKASFPGQGRRSPRSTSVNNMGYLIGGSNYLGYTEELGYSHDYYSDLYQYSEENNTWSLISSHDNFEDQGNIVGNDQSLYVFPYSTFRNIYEYEWNTGNFETIGSIGVRGSFYPFATDGEVFHFTVQNNTTLSLKKHGANNEWQTISTFELNVTGSAEVIINFAFVQGGVAYVGYNQLNSQELTMLSADLDDLVINEKARVEIMSSDIALVKYLFTIDHLAYFIEIGSSSVGPDRSDVAIPGDYLYIYNQKSESWKISEHAMPESFFGVASFGLNNRGFAGMGTSANSPLFSYSQKFYEFVPQ
ncbi:MAG: hypothetical protein ABJF04_12050 [Reichenbachiella sp.]|uniref:hypothetical protein n=3 Tax=Reichenbachiella sp. TaxID=2184521 RepID=UPI003263A227